MYKDINIFKNINIMETVIEMYNCKIKKLKIIKWWAIGMSLILGFFTVVNGYIHIPPLTVYEDKLMLLLQIAGVCIFLWTVSEIERIKRELIKIRLDVEPGDYIDQQKTRRETMDKEIVVKKYSDEAAHLIAKISEDEQLLSALAKYFELKDGQKEAVYGYIDALYEQD